MKVGGEGGIVDKASDLAEALINVRDELRGADLIVGANSVLLLHVYLS